MAKRLAVRKPRVASKRRVAAARRRKYGVIIRPMPKDTFYTVILNRPMQFIPRQEQP